MVILQLWLKSLLIIKLVYGTNAATHWIVTEKGLIQAHEGSPLDLRRPYDLISLLDQEKRWTEIRNVLTDLMVRKTNIEQKWSNLQEKTDLNSKISLKNTECLMTAKLLDSVDLYDIATNGSERVEIKLQIEDDVRVYQIPECNKYSRLEFTKSDYQHFPSLHAENNISLIPDDGLEWIIPRGSVKLFGHEIHKELVKNSSSWVHYNLASLFWRIKGNGTKALDCSKRALHYVTRRYQDIPLHNLAGIIHKAGRSKEAVLMLLKALEYAPNPNLHYLALGNIYFALGDYNNSLVYLEKFIELGSKHDVTGIKQVSLCFSKLEAVLVDLQENVLGYFQGILADLHNFHSLQQHWLRLSKRLMWEHASFDDEMYSLNDEVLDVLFTKKSQRCVKTSSTISCDLVDSVSELDTINLQNLFQYVESETQKINEQLSKTRLREPLVLDGGAPLVFPKFPTSMSTHGEKYFDATGWPQEDECNKWNLPINEKEELKIPVFLPPENKGYDINKALSDSIELPKGSEHDLPWYPPVCEDGNGDKFLQTPERYLQGIELKSNQFLRNHFIKYVNNGKTDEAEIGQRIITAMDQKAAPRWMLSTLASLYWRVRGNPKKALDCLDAALKTAPKDQTDVILVSLASVLHQLGFEAPALKYANLAFKLNYVEPSTNLLLALLNYESNPLMAMYHLKNVLRVDAEYYDGHVEFLLKLWGCRIKLGSYNNVKQPVEKVPQEVCSEKESFKGEGMICSANGDDCKAASIQCFHAKNFEDTGVIKRLRLRSGKRAIATAESPEAYMEPDQSQLERIGDGGSQPIQMRILMGDERSEHGPTPEFYVGFSEDSAAGATLHVYDKSGTYPLSSQTCKEIVEADWVHFTSMWQSIAARNIDIGPFLKPLPKSTKKRTEKPYCADATLNPSDTVLNHITSKILRIKFTTSPDRSLSEWLGIMAGDNTASIEEIGAKIAQALHENNTSWLLATAAALFWRAVGNAEEAVVCLKLSLNYVPEEMRDVPLISFASILQRFGFNSDALEVAYLALKSNPNFVVNHFTIGNILTSLGDLEEAIAFQRSALALDGSFEPARNRLQAILCTLLFDESGSLRNIPDK